MFKLFHGVRSFWYHWAMPKGYLTTRQAAERLKTTQQAIRDLIKNGRLTAERFGPVWMIAEKEVDSFTPGKAGRPKKNTS